MESSNPVAMATLTHETEICIPCRQQFVNWDAYLKHMITSLRHPFACVVCGQEYRSERAQMSHQLQVHAADQNIVCIGCEKRFTRCSAYIEHIETDSCHVIRKEAFDKIRDVNDEYYKKRAKKQKPITGGVDSGEVRDAPSRTEDRMNYFDSPIYEEEFEEFKKKFPPLKVTKAAPSSTVTVVTMEAIEGYTAIPSLKDTTASTETSNYIGSTETSLRTNIPMLTKQPFSVPITSNAAIGDARDISSQKKNAALGERSNTILPEIPFRSPARPHQKFFATPPKNAGAPNVSPGQSQSLRPAMLTRAGPDLSAIQRTSNILQPFQDVKPNEQLKPVQAIDLNSSQSAPKYYHQYDPDQPGFDLDQYKNAYSKKYKCAFPGCTKLQNSKQALYMHLKSKAHLTELSTCPICLNQFHSATALFQHLESQTNKCNARYDPRFRQIVDQVAGGMIDTAGTHIDDTHRYYSTRIMPKLELQTVHEADEETITNAIHDPEYRTARENEHQQRLREQTARIEAWDNAEWTD